MITQIQGRTHWDHTGTREGDTGITQIQGRDTLMITQVQGRDTLVITQVQVMDTGITQAQGRTHWGSHRHKGGTLGSTQVK